MGSEILKSPQVTLVTGVAALLTGTMNTGETVATLAGGMYADLVLTGAFAAAVAINKSIHVYRRDLNIDGTADAPLPVVADGTNDYEHKYLCSFDVVPNTTAPQSIHREGVFVPNDCELYLKNDTGQTLNLGYTLKATPWTWSYV